MLRLLLFYCIYISINTSVYSQNFVSKDNKWIINHTYELDTGEEEIAPFFFWFKDEVVIDGKSYLQLHKAKIGEPTIIPLEAFYREENRVVFFHDGTDEKVLYDFDRNAGDTFIINESVELKVEDLKTVTLLSGGNTRSFEFTTRRSYRVIEGIGASSNPFELSDNFFEDEVCCFFKIGKLAYSFNQDPFDKNFPCSDYDPSYADLQFVNRQNEWVIGGYSSIPPTSSMVDTCFFEDEKVINNKLYFYNGCGIFGGWFREEENRVYRYNPSEDKLLYDFNLTVGDTFYYTDTQFFVLECEEEIEFFDGSIGKVFHIIDSEQPDAFNLLINGIGTLSFPFSPGTIAIPDYNETLDRFYRNDKIVYAAPFIEYECATNDPKFVTKDNLWVVNEEWYDPLVQKLYVRKIFYSFRNETKINGNDYLELHVEKPSIGVSRDLGILYRELSDGRVHIVSRDFNYMYDFNLGIGESVIYNDSPPLEVSEIDTIALLDDTQARLYSLFKTPGQDLGKYNLIEGIGLNLYPLIPHRYGTVDFTEKLTCFYRNGELVYRLDDTVDCTVFSTDSEEVVAAGTVSLSYFDSRIYIKGADYEELTLSILGLTGQLINEAEITSDSYPVSDLPTGLVICQLKNSNRLIHAQTLFIN